MNNAQEHPNFLIICTDQMRADHMGCAGNPVIRTPHLDALAAQGVNLSRAYVNCPLCMPGRATLFTGLTPRGHRVRTNGIPLDPSFPTVPGALAEAGYRTGSIGKIHLSMFGYGQRPDLSLLPPDRFPNPGSERVSRKHGCLQRRPAWPLSFPQLPHLPPAVWQLPQCLRVD